jgi:hypothetical protein
MSAFIYPPPPSTIILEMQILGGFRLFTPFLLKIWILTLSRCLFQFLSPSTKTPPMLVIYVSEEAHQKVDRRSNKVEETIKLVEAGDSIS